MKQEQKEFFDLLDEFRKLHIGSMLPGIPHGEACVLKAIREVESRKSSGEAIRVSDLIEELHVPAPAVSRGLKSLEERGLICRRVDEKDRRNTFVELTAEGQAMTREIETIMEGFAEAVFERVGAASFEQLNQSLRTLIHASREEVMQRKYIEKEKGE